MEYEVIVPRFDQDGALVTISSWVKSVGDHVTKGEVIAEVDSDTATCEIVAPVTGVLDCIFIPEGKTTRLGMQIATIKAIENETEKEIVQQLEKEKIEEKILEHQVEHLEEMTEKAIDEMVIKNTDIEHVYNKLEQEKNRHDYKTVINTVENDDFQQAIKLAKEGDIHRFEDDVSGWKHVKKLNHPEDAVRKMDEFTIKIAQQRLRARTSAVISTVMNEIDMTSIIDAHRNFGRAFTKKHNVRLGYTPFIIKAITQALKEFPNINSYVIGDDIMSKTSCDIAIAAGGNDFGHHPVIRMAELKPIAELEREMIALTERAEKGEITPEEMSGATFTLINAGIFGSLMGSDVIIYPQTSSLTMHKVKERPVVLDGNIIARPMMYVSFSFDHRVINSKSASLFLDKVRTYAENISWLTLDI